MRESLEVKNDIRNSLFAAEGVYPQNYMVDQQRLQISELHYDKFSTLSTSSCWKTRFKTQVSACSSSSSEAMLWIKEVEMVDSVDYIFHHRFQCKGTLVSRIMRYWMRGSRPLCTRSLRIFLQEKKSQSAGTECSKRGSILSRKTDRLHDLRLLTGCWRS